MAIKKVGDRFHVRYEDKATGLDTKKVRKTLCSAEMQFLNNTGASTAHHAGEVRVASLIEWSRAPRLADNVSPNVVRQQVRQLEHDLGSILEIPLAEIDSVVLKQIVEDLRLRPPTEPSKRRQTGRQPAQDFPATAQPKGKGADKQRVHIASSTL